MVGIQAFWKSLLGIWEEFFVVLFGAFVGGLLMLPLLLSLLAFSGGFAPVGLILLVVGVAGTAPFALAGHYALADQIAEAKSASWRTWWEGSRAYWKPTALWFTLFVGLIALLLINFRFYNGIEAAWASWLQGFWLVLLVGWIAVNLYVMPLYLLQVRQEMRLAFRNAALMAASDPITIVVLLLVLGLMLAILNVIALPLVVLLPPFAALLGATAVRLRLQKVGLWKPFGSESPEEEAERRSGSRAPENQRPVRPRDLDDR